MLRDLRRVAANLGKSPTADEYREYGTHSPTTFQNRFETWNNAKRAAGLSRCDGGLIRTKQFLKDLRQVALDLGRSPKRREYDDHGKYGTTTIENRFDGWNNALITAGLEPNKPHIVTSEELLRHMRKKAEDVDIVSTTEFVKETLDHGHGSYDEAFGGLWAAVVRAGLIPSNGVPLSEEDYDSYIQTALDASRPSESLYGLLQAFTGLPPRLLDSFSLDWISRVESELQPPLIRVPAGEIPIDNNWEIILPTQYTTATGNQKSTHIRSLIRWLRDESELCSLGRNAKKDRRHITQEIIERADIDATTADLRGSVAAHLARLKESRFKIEMQFGASKTGWRRSVNDYLLYLYQFENYNHPDYNPHGVYLDPNTGDMTKATR